MQPYSLLASAKRHTRTSGPYAASASRLANSLINIRAIISHFGPKVEAWSLANKHEPMSPENVLAIVRDNYDTLTLKLQVGTTVSLELDFETTLTVASR